MSRLVPRVFVDFDGTITTKDVGNEFFRRFGDVELSLRLVDQWKRGILSGKELLLGEARSVKVSYHEALEYVREFQIDKSFSSFVDFCRSSNIKLSILSDGLSFYIESILEKNGISGIDIYSNRAGFVPPGIEIETPFESDCTWCANCKGNQILMNSGIDDAIIYVGNGFSDRCAVKYADAVFAKDELLKYCEDNNITYFPFRSFDDVSVKMKKLIAAGGIRKRHQAELRRREAYLAE